MGLGDGEGAAKMPHLDVQQRRVDELLDHLRDRRRGEVCEQSALP